MRQEVELAKVEAKQSATRAGKGSGMLAGAGVAGHFVLLFLSVALWYAVGEEWTGFGLSAVIVAVLWAFIAAILAFRGRKELKAIRGLPDRRNTPRNSPHPETQLGQPMSDNPDAIRADIKQPAHD